MASLPRQVDSFVGRDDAVRGLGRLLDEATIATVVGPGGVGKTRLALEASSRAAVRFPDGVWLVDLSGARSPDDVAGAVAVALAITPGAADAVPLLAERLGQRRVLLLLDNCEHLVQPVATLVAALARDCPGLTVLATSREPLAVRGERLFPVPPLAEADAVRLFLDRARAADPGFDPGPADVRAVAAICRRLDALPLAIELAAPWVRTFAPSDLLPLLTDHLALPPPDVRDRPPRQRTMRATVEWSHELLAVPQRVLFRRLGVFAGPFGLPAAQRICGGPPLREELVAPVLAALHDRSLLVVERAEGTGRRYRLLEVVRELALERLAESGETDELRRRHLEHHLTEAERVDTRRQATGSDAGVAELLRAADDHRAALAWALEHDPDRGLRLAAALESFWMVRSVAEGRSRLQQALERAPEPTAARARALTVAPLVVAGGLPWPEARRLVSEAIAIRESAGDRTGVAAARLVLALATFFAGELDAALRSIDDALATGPLPPLLDARARIYRATVLAFSPGGLGEGRRRLEEGRARAAAIGDGWGRGMALTMLGLADLRAGDPDAAHRHLRDALGGALQAGVTAAAVGGFGELTLRTDARRGLVLLEAASAVRERTGVAAFPVPVGRQLERARTTARRRLAGPVAERCRARARAMTTEEAISFALAPCDDGDAGRLTPRQQEVALLVAAGASNREIAERLSVSVRTAETHVGHVLESLGLHRRTDLAAWAHETGLAPRSP
ncbi:ATP-binding protein [Geodermatophilus sp. URMC 64]